MPNLLCLIMALSLVALSENACELCMDTYKVKCTICYQECESSKTLNSCSYQECLNYDSSGSCTEYANATALDNSTCLPKCCAGSQAATAGFTEQKFNQCIEADAKTKSTINVGLTIGLMVGLVVLLVLFGLCYVLSFLCFDDKVLGDSPGNIPTEDHLDRKERFSASQKSNTFSWVNKAQKDKLLANPCSKCKKQGCNLLTFCQHPYHLECLLNKNQQAPQCMICHSNCDSVKIYCSNCHKSYTQYNPTHNRNFTYLSRATCNKCP